MKLNNGNSKGGHVHIVYEICQEGQEECSPRGPSKKRKEGNRVNPWEHLTVNEIFDLDEWLKLPLEQQLGIESMGTP